MIFPSLLEAFKKLIPRRKFTSYVIGTPSYEESNMLWKRHNTDNDVTGDEFEKSEVSLGSHLSKKMTLCAGLEEGDGYLRGDFFGDRTHYLELYYPELLTLNFVDYLQEWVKSYEEGIWRIFIPTYSGRNEEVIVIYDTVIRISEYYEKDLAQAYKELVTSMRDKDCNGNLNKEKVRQQH